MRLKEIKALLDKEAERRNSYFEISPKKPDPLLIAREYPDETIALICALFAYGNVSLIVKFLQSLDFRLLKESDEAITKALSSHYYRFQNAKDISSFFIALKRLKEIDSIENIVYAGYRKNEDILEGLWKLIDRLRSVYPYKSRGYDFLVGSLPGNKNRMGTYKRYMMYLRWMVRKDHLDLGLWTKIDKKDLLLPLDTHTFKVSRRLGLLKRKSYDMKAVLEITQRLQRFDKADPMKYDFALYRLGQEKLE